MHPIPLGPLIGTAFVAAFAVVWVAMGARSLAGRWPLMLSLLALAVSAAVVWREYRFLRVGVYRLGRFNGTAYGAAVTFEAVMIPLVAAILRRNGGVAYILPAISVLVGIHFFGLVWAFDSRACWWIGGAMCLVPIVAVTCLPVATRRMSDGGETRWWDVVVGLGCAMILWFSMLTQF